MNETVNIEGLKQLSKELTNYNEELKKIYNDKLLQLLVECKPYFDKNNISYERELSDYRRLYNELNRKLSNYSDLLGNSIANSYNETKNDINELFNNNFKNILNEIMDKE